MAGMKQLPSVRFATSGDKPSAPMSLADAIERGSRLDELRAMRRIVSAHLSNPDTLARDISSLANRQMAISAEIEQLTPSVKDDLGKAADTDDEKFNPRAV